MKYSYLANRKKILAIVQSSIFLSLEGVWCLHKIPKSCQGKRCSFYQSLPANSQTFFLNRHFTWVFVIHLQVYLLNTLLHVVMKRNHWNVSLRIFMFSCANLYYRHAQSNSYLVLTFKSVKITDMKSTLIWISYYF